MMEERIDVVLKVLQEARAYNAPIRSIELVWEKVNLENEFKAGNGSSHQFEIRQIVVPNLKIGYGKVTD